MTSPPISEEELERRIAEVPRIRLAHLPTPLEEMSRLRRHLGGSQLFVKRDDLTGLAFGGNKVRNLEFRMAEAAACGADTVLMWVDILSNSARQTAAAAVRLGMAPVLVLRGELPARVTGNLLIDHLLGAEIHHIAADADPEAVTASIAERLRAAGRRPLILNRSTLFTFSAALAYALATIEILRQLRERGVDGDHVRLYISSSGKGQAGLELALRALGLSGRAVGSSAKRTAGSGATDVARFTTEAANRLGLDLVVRPEEVDNRDWYVGAGYGLPSPAGDEALHLAAEYEGLLLDPVYTAKAFAALVDDVRHERIPPDDAAVFVHTGGLPLIFEYAEHLASDANDH